MLADLGDLLAPLKQIGSTLSLLGFESSKSIVLDQVEQLTALAETGQTATMPILNVAGALVQVDENLASLTQSGKGEVEKITDEAQRAVAEQTRDGLDRSSNPSSTTYRRSGTFATCRMLRRHWMPWPAHCG
jgi:DNA anti-recombination protein RmuC